MVIQLCKFYLDNSATQTIYFPTPFTQKPGLFFGMEYSVWGAGDGTRWPCQITEVTSTYFTITNPQSNMDPVIHWMAVKQGTGTIYGQAYKCEVKNLGTNWSSHQTMTYSGLGSTPICLCNLQTRNASSNKYSPNLGGSSSSTQIIFHIGINDQSSVYTAQNVSTAETCAFFAITKTNVANKMYLFEKGSASHVHGTSSNPVPIQNPICIGCSKNAGGDSLNLYANRITSHRTLWYIKEVPGRDGSHTGTENAYIMQMAGTTTGNSKPLLHFCANHASSTQGISDNANMATWYNISQRGAKYAVGYGSGSNRPTLKNDGNGKYVQFDASNSEYFKLPCPITWTMKDAESQATGGVTAFAVAKFKNMSTDNWPRIFEFGIPGTGSSTETKEGYTYYKAINEGTSGFGGTLHGNASKQSGYVSLTTNGNSQNGQIEYTGIYPGNRMYTTFDTWIGGGNGADAVWFYWGATTRPTSEDGGGGAYLFAIDEYGSNELQLEWNGGRLETKTMGNIDDGQWHSWAIEWESNTIKIWRDGNLEITKNDSARTLNTNSKIGWGGRTGGLNNHHRVRNMKLWVSSENGTGYIDNGNPSTETIMLARNGTGSQMRFQSKNPTTQYDTTNSPASGSWGVYSVRYDNYSRTCTMATNATTFTPTETTQNYMDNRTTTNNIIGGDVDIGNFSDIDLRELIIWDDCLSTTQIADINAHLVNKWNIGVPTQTTAYSDLLAWYQCEESSGSTLADSKGSHNMTLYNSAWYTHVSDSVDGGERSIEFSRSSNTKAYDSSSLSYGLAKLSNLGSININQFTISCWTKFTQTSYHGTLWQFSSPSSYHQVFFRLAYIVDGGGYWSVLQRYKETSSSTNYNDAVETSSGAVNYHNDVWHNLVVTKSGNTTSDTLKLYINGSLVGSTNLTNSGGKDFSGKIDHLAFGAGWHYNKWNWWSKAMKTDDYRIYNRALTASEVTELYATQ